jgi:hypothetical protein
LIVRARKVDRAACPRRPWQSCVRERDRDDVVSNPVAGGARAARGGVDVHEHLLCGRGRMIIALSAQLVKQVKALVVEPEQLRRYCHAVARE